MNLSTLKPYQERRFVPQDIDLSDVAKIKGLYETLEARQINSAKELEDWLMDLSELNAVLSQTGSVLYIDMTCHTDDPAIAQAYTHFVQTIPPAVKPLHDRLNRKYLKLRELYALDPKRYKVYDRDVKTDVELFVEKNVGLQTNVNLLSQEYQTVCGAMTVYFDGKTYTLPQMGKFLLETDRDLRERAWKTTAHRRLDDKDKLEEIFNRMFSLRNEIASNAGFKNFIDYQFKAYRRFDYTPQDCKQYHQTVQELIVPLNEKILKQRQKEMGLSSLRPWDTAVDSLGRKPLLPFKEANALVKGMQAIFDKLDKDFASQFKMMKEQGLLDLVSHPGKAPGGYQNTLNEARKPFIFMNAVGIDDDVRTLLHEAGHAFHALACADDPLVDYRHAPMEFSEVASMAMELLAGRHLNEFYQPKDVQRSNREHLEGIIQTLSWVANIDAFQHWLYEHPQHAPEERRLAWLKLYEQFGGQFIDWTGLEDIKGHLWHRQLHIFEVPFYYIEYGIAQLGALQIWLKAHQNPQRALADYKRGLSLGGSLPVRDLYHAAGISFDFSMKMIKPLVEAVCAEWEKLV